MVINGQYQTWTPDFNLLITSLNNSDLLIVSLQGSILTNLTNTPNIAEFDGAMSPDGTMIAYTSNEDPAGAPNNPTAGFSSNLWLMDSDGQNRGILWESNSGGEYRGNPDWAPDSSRIAFIDNGDVWTTPPDGNNPTNITNDEPIQDHPAWSPDGTQIAYSQMGTGTDSEIFRINIDTRQVAGVSNDPGANDRHPHWQPWPVQNGRLTFTSTSPSSSASSSLSSPPTITSSDLDGSHRSAFGFRQFDSDEGFLSDPAWSPDGTRLAVVGESFTSSDVFVVVVSTTGSLMSSVQGAYPSWFPDNRGLVLSRDGDLWVVDTAELAPNPVNITNTANGVEETDSAVSPDGRWIAFSSNESPGGNPNNPMPGNNFDLYLKDVDGIERLPIVQSATYQGSPSWSPDGKRVAYGDGGDIWTVDPFNPIDRVKITDDAGFQRSPAWSPDGKLIAFGQQTSLFSRDSQLWVIDVITKQRTRITNDPDLYVDGQPTWQPLWAPGSDNYYVWGDNNCAGQLDELSALNALIFMSGLEPPHVPGCPYIGELGLITSTNEQTEWGNLDCESGIDSDDIINTLLYIIEYVPPEQAQAAGIEPIDTCPAIDDYIQWLPLTS